VPRWLRLAAVVMFIAATAAAVQFDAPGRGHRSDLTYNGQFTFVRLRWVRLRPSRRGGFSSAWNPPRGTEPGSCSGVTALTFAPAAPDSHADDPELFATRFAHVGPGFGTSPNPKRSRFGPTC
jgi:hypothetical protein